jgi:hypothetical protein
VWQLGNNNLKSNIAGTVWQLGNNNLKSNIAGTVWQLGNNATASGDYVVNTLSAVANGLSNPSAVVVPPPKSQNHYHRIVVPTSTTTTACNSAKITATFASSIHTFTFAPEQSYLTQSSTCKATPWVHVLRRDGLNWHLTLISAISCGARQSWDGTRFGTQRAGTVSGLGRRDSTMMRKQCTGLSGRA